MGMLGPLAVDVSVAGVSGVATGYAVKRLGQTAAAVIGTGIVVLKVLEYNQYISVHWDRVSSTDECFAPEPDAENIGHISIPGTWEALAVMWARREAPPTNP